MPVIPDIIGEGKHLLPTNFDPQFFKYIYVNTTVHYFHFFNLVGVVITCISTNTTNTKGYTWIIDWE